MTRAERKSREAIATAQYYSSRSSCWVQAGAVLQHRDGNMMVGGWNHAGPDGMGQHAEAHVLSRLPKFQRGLVVSITVAKFNGKKWLTSPPCSNCRQRIKAAGIPLVRYFDGDEWITESV